MQGIIAIAKTDSLKVALPVINGFLGQLVANPSVSNVAMQAAAFQVNIMAALPNLESDAIHDLAALVQTQVNTLAASVAS